MKNNDENTTDSKTLIIEDRVLAAGFVQLPRVVLQSRNLTRDAKLLYAILLSYAWQDTQCFPGYRRLCHDMQAGETTVRQYMRELQTHGLISWRRRGLNKTNVYTLLKLYEAHLVREPSKTEVPDPQIFAVKEEPEEKDVSLRNSKIQRDAFQGPTEAEIPSPTARTLRAQQDSEHTPGFAGIGEVIAQRRSQYQGLNSAAQRSGTPLQIRAAMRQLTDEFGDTAHRASNLTRVARLFSRSNMEASGFVSLLYEARSITRDRARDASMRKPMAYYFIVLEDLLGFRQTTDIPSG